MIYLPRKNHGTRRRTTIWRAALRWPGTKGRNIALTFTDEKGNATSDWFGVVRYQWYHEPDGSVIEERLDKDGKIVPLRGDFQFMRTRMTFDGQGYFGRLQNIDESGELVNTASGAAVFQYDFDTQGRFNRWEVYDKDGLRAIGPSGTAGEQNTFYKYDLENIIFFDQQLNPAMHWSGAGRWHFEIDEFGNNILLEFQNGQGKPMNTNNGFSRYVAEWTENGRHLLAEAYFDQEGHKTTHKISGVHRIEYTRDYLGLITEKRYLDIDLKLVNRKDNGVAFEKMDYDLNHKPIKTNSFNTKGKPVQNP